MTCRSVVGSVFARARARGRSVGGYRPVAAVLLARRVGLSQRLTSCRSRDDDRARNHAAHVGRHTEKKRPQRDGRRIAYCCWLAEW